MGKSKKKFVDKNRSSQTFSLVHRSQRDISDAHDALTSPGVLIPSRPPNSKSTVVGAPLLSTSDDKPLPPPASKPPAAIHKAAFVTPDGFLNDGYDYSKHLRTLTSGTVTLPSGKKVSREEDVMSKVMEESSGADGEVDRVLESITLTTEGMDQDVADVLFGDDIFGGAEGGGDLLDDFCEVAGKASLELEELKEKGYYIDGGRGLGLNSGEGGVAGLDSFDYDEHIRRLIEKSERKGGDAVFRENAEGASFFSGLKPRGGRIEEGDEEDGDDDEDNDSGYFDDGAGEGWDMEVSEKVKAGE